MKHYSIITSHILILTVVFSLALPKIGVAQAPGTKESDTIALRDVKLSDWFASAVKKVADAGIMQGYRDSTGKLTGEFGPGNPVRRAEFIKMVAMMMVYRYQFDRTQVPTGSKWYSLYLDAIKAVDPIDTILPVSEQALGQPILRHEAAGLIQLGLGQRGQSAPTGTTFSDVTVETPNAAAILQLKSKGVISGDGKTGKFEPHRTLNRAEAAKILVVTAEAFKIPLGAEVQDTRIIWEPADGLLQGTLLFSLPNSTESINSDPPVLLKTFEDKAWGISIGLPWNPAWGTKTLRMHPYQKRTTDVLFGPVTSCDSSTLCREHALSIIPARSAEKIHEEIGKITEKCGENLADCAIRNPREATLNETVHLFLWNAGSKPGAMRAEIIGKKYNYVIETNFSPALLDQMLGSAKILP